MVRRDFDVGCVHPSGEHTLCTSLLLFEGSSTHGFNNPHCDSLSHFFSELTLSPPPPPPPPPPLPHCSLVRADLPYSFVPLSLSFTIAMYYPLSFPSPKHLCPQIIITTIISIIFLSVYQKHVHSGHHQSADIHSFIHSLTFILL